MFVLLFVKGLNATFKYFERKWSNDGKKLSAKISFSFLSIYEKNVTCKRSRPWGSRPRRLTFSPRPRPRRSHSSPRRDRYVGKMRLETETSRPRLHPWSPTHCVEVWWWGSAPPQTFFFISGSRNAYFGAFSGPPEYRYLLLHCNTSRSRLPVRYARQVWHSTRFKPVCGSKKGAAVPAEEHTEHYLSRWWQIALSHPQTSTQWGEDTHNPYSTSIYTILALSALDLPPPSLNANSGSAPGCVIVSGSFVIKFFPYLYRK